MSRRVCHISSSNEIPSNQTRPIHTLPSVVAVDAAALYTMSLARRFAFRQIQAGLFSRPPVASRKGSLIAARLLVQSQAQGFATSSRRLLAQPVSDHHNHHHHNHSKPSKPSQSSLDVNPYANSSSALDKAVHLFFFTEILRGMQCTFSRRMDSVSHNAKLFFFSILIDQECGL